MNEDVCNICGIAMIEIVSSFALVRLRAPFRGGGTIDDLWNLVPCCGGCYRTFRGGDDEQNRPGIFVSLALAAQPSIAITGASSGSNNNTNSGGNGVDGTTVKRGHHSHQKSAGGGNEESSPPMVRLRWLLFVKWKQLQTDFPSLIDPSLSQARMMAVLYSGDDIAERDRLYDIFKQWGN
jgi:hypothetical protein